MLYVHFLNAGLGFILLLNHKGIQEDFKVGKGRLWKVPFPEGTETFFQGRFAWTCGMLGTRGGLS